MNGLVLALVVGSLMPGPSGDVNLLLQGCSTDEPEVSCTYQGTEDIYWAPPFTRGDLLHELGHQFDYDNMDDTARAEFEAINGDPRPWRSAPNSPHEQFAEAYRLCATRRHWPKPGADFSVGYNLKLGPKRFKRACAIIRSRSSASRVPSEALAPGNGSLRSLRRSRGRWSPR